MHATSIRCAAAPGRVNLIGEHIDYNGLPVLPMAIDRDVQIEFRPLDEPVVRLAGAAGQFLSFAFRLDRRIERARDGHWSNYVRAAARGLAGHGVALERGIEGVVRGRLPVAAGLSSSSALVVASALGLLDANGAQVPRLELAALLAKAERFAGLEGGGMDQAASLCGRRGHALRINFEPLRVTPVAIPARWRWVVAFSLAHAEKTRAARDGGAQDAYNARPRECRAALARMTAAWPPPAGAGAPSPVPRTYAEIALACGSVASPRAGNAPSASGAAISAPATPIEIDELLERAGRVLEPVLLRRFRHVLTEARRVELAQAAMADSRMTEFGALMVRSHESLRDDYEASTRELDQIVATAVGAGAAGARLTGAGFGGCVVALCDPSAAPKVMDALSERFYGPQLGRPPRSSELFTARAADGARITGGSGATPSGVAASSGSPRPA